MSNKTVEAILRLSSKLGSMKAFRDLGSHLDRVDQKVKSFNRSQSMIVASSKNMHAAMVRYAAPAALAAGGVATVKAFAEIERRMERIGITADASAAETSAALDKVRQVADDVRAPVEMVVDGLDSMVASGKAMKEALELLPAVARTSQAADADFGQMATTADAIANSLGIANGKMEQAFDIIAKGGKEGKFELKDMASELPSLAPAFAALGYKGEAGLTRLVAYLQTVRMETGTSSEAATSFMDVITKMESETVANNFKKKFGVDLRGGLEDAKRRGADPLEAFFKLAHKAIKGDMSKLPQLFTDKQMLIGARAIMRNADAIERYEEAMSHAAGTVDADLARIVRTTESKLDRIGNSWRRLKESIGGGLVDLGAGALMDNASEQMSKAQAINKSLDGQGLSWAQKRMWWLKNGNVFADQSAQDAEAWKGGYRTDLERHTTEGFAAFARSRKETGTPPPPSGKFGLPTKGPIPATREGRSALLVSQTNLPIPTARPSADQLTREAVDRQIAARDLARQYAEYGRRHAVPAVVRKDPETAMADLMRPIGSLGKRPGATFDSMLAGMDQVGDAIAQGGSDAGQSIQQAAGAAGNSIESAASAIVTAGQQAAEAIRSAARDLMRPIGSLQGGRVSGNPGRTMPNAGTPPGGQ